MEKIIIIDGTSLIFRSFYALKNPMITKDGIQTQGIYGFLNMLFKVLKDQSPSHAAVAWDVKKPTFRHESYGEYKAGRKPMPIELIAELPYMKEILDAMSIKNIECPGFEADDIIGTLAKASEDKDFEVLVVTGDKDALQLVSEKTKVMINQKGVSKATIYDINEMKNVYSLTPVQFIEYKALIGDKSDNIPGVPGVGDKTGKDLLVTYGDIETIYNNLDNLKGKKLKENLIEYKDQLEFSKMLATIVKDAPIDLDLDQYVIGDYDSKKLLELFEKLEFNSFIKKLELKNQSPKPEIEPLRATSIKALDDLKPLEELSDESILYLKLFSDYSHLEEPEINGIGYVIGEECFYLDQPLFFPTFWDILKKKNLKYNGFSIKDDLFILLSKGIEAFDVEFDSQIAKYILDSSRSNYNLEGIAQEELGMEISFKDEALDLDFVSKYFSIIKNLENVYRKQLDENNLTDIAREIEFPLIRVLANMEHNGVGVSEKVLSEIGEKFDRLIENLEKSIWELAGHEFNINSPSQLGEVLFEELGLKAGKKNKTGYSTSAQVLKKLKNDHEIVALILDYRGLTKLNSTYIHGLNKLICEDGRIRTSFKQAAASTGRISSTDPNLQNIPIRSEEGRNIRKAFIPAEGNLLIGADYSQIELRVLAHLSGDEHLIEAFNKGDDIHRLTASKVFDIPFDQVSGLDRSRAKAINFGVIYGMSGFGLSEGIGITVKDAEKYIKDYFDKYSAVKNFMDQEIEKCKELGYTTTMFGRKRYIPELKASNFMVRQAGERLAMNTPIQGTAADIIKIAMIKVFYKLKDVLPEAKLILQVHDELIIECSKADEKIAKELLKSSMEEATKLKVKLESNVTSGDSWYLLK